MPQDPSGGPLIRGCVDGDVVIGQRRWRESFLIQPGFDVVAWNPPLLAAFDAAVAADLLAREPALVILGCGPTQAFPPPAFAARLLGAGIGLETMPTAAAARTFNLLVGEGRVVLGAFILGVPLQPA